MANSISKIPNPTCQAGPDPVLSDVWDGTCSRELAGARDGLADARDRYDAAVLKARTAGFSRGEIGNVLGVSRQQLHRRFSTRRRRQHDLGNLRTGKGDRT